MRGTAPDPPLGAVLPRAVPAAGVGRALVDGHPTPSTIALIQEVFLRFADDDERRQVEVSRFLPALIGCVAQIAAQAMRELETRGIEMDWRSD